MPSQAKRLPKVAIKVIGDGAYSVIELGLTCLLGLYSLVVLLGHALHPDGAIPAQQAAWYPKAQATFSAVLATVRRHVWAGLTFQTSPADPDDCLVSRSELNSLLQAVCS